MKGDSFIPVAQPDLSGNEKKYLNQCLNSSWISSKGEFIGRFEASFAKFIGVKFACSTINGTAALHLALVALGIGKGDEVIVPDLTFIASANAISFTGAKPVLVDVERKTWNIDPERIEEAITSRTKAIMIVHLYGHPADMQDILPIAQRYHLKVIEDAAEAHGAEIKIIQSTNSPITKLFKKNGRGYDFSDGGEVWKKVGSIGDIGCFSFYGNKIVTTGEGGMVVTNDEALAQKIKVLKDHGQKPNKRYYHEVIGFNYRMTNLQAAIGLAQLERIEDFINKKRRIAELYDHYLRGVSGLTLPPKVSWARSVFWMYSILVNHPYPETRDQLISIFKKKNIETRPFFYPLHKLPPYKQGGDFVNSCFLSTHGMNLPSGMTLSEADIKRVVQMIKEQIQ